jgi:hypothetical protein
MYGLVIRSTVLQPNISSLLYDRYIGLAGLNFSQFLFYPYLYWSRDSSVDTAISYELDVLGSNSGRNVICLFSTTSKPVIEPTQPHIKCLTGGDFPGVERPGHEADNSPASSADIKKGAVIPPLSNMSS